jgi:uncharacterized LabA/DUF88 family protein
MALEVSVESKVIDTSKANLAVDEEARIFQKESWPLRREIYKRNASGEIKLNMMTTAEWMGKTTNPVLVLIDGTFAHSAAVYYAKKYIDYRKLRQGLSSKSRNLFYFSANQDSERITRFLHYVKSIEGCKVIVKQVPKILDSRDKGSSHIYRSVAVDLSIVALRELYTNDEIQHVLILSRDPELIPTIKEIKDLGATVTLARSADIPTSRYLLSEATYVLDVYEFFEAMAAYSDTPIREKDGNENNYQTQAELEEIDQNEPH